MCFALEMQSLRRGSEGIDDEHVRRRSRIPAGALRKADSDSTLQHASLFPHPQVIRRRFASGTRQPCSPLTRLHQQEAEKKVERRFLELHEMWGMEEMRSEEG